MVVPWQNLKRQLALFMFISSASVHTVPTEHMHIRAQTFLSGSRSRVRKQRRTRSRRVTRDRRRKLAHDPPYLRGPIGLRLHYGKVLGECEDNKKFISKKQKRKRVKISTTKVIHLKCIGPDICTMTAEYLTATLPGLALVPRLGLRARYGSLAA